MFFHFKISMKENAFTQTHDFDNTQNTAVTAISFNQNSQIIAAGMANGRIILLNLNAVLNGNDEKLIIGETYMSQPICCICIQPSSK